MIEIMKSESIVEDIGERQKRRDDVKRFLDNRKNLPEKHPFESAYLCKQVGTEGLYAGEALYTAEPSSYVMDCTAYTYPTYDEKSNSLYYKKINIITKEIIGREISVDYLIEVAIKLKTEEMIEELIEIKHMFNIPNENVQRLIDNVLERGIDRLIKAVSD